MSHPVWVRGLKLLLLTHESLHIKSHPVWVRGLKHAVIFNRVRLGQVAPRVGAWIETRGAESAI